MRHLLAAACVWLSYSEGAKSASTPDASLGEFAFTRAIATLERAVDKGVHRERLLSTPGLAKLKDDPRGRELLARVPE